jgi:signal transduction histidine kinase/CheY-like chemotaxis protein
MALAVPKPTSTARPWLAALVFGTILVVGATVVLWHLRSDALNSQARELSLLSLALTEDLDRGLQGAEEGLRAMRMELQEGRLSSSDADVQRALSTRAELMPLIRTLWLVDRNGVLLAASDATRAPQLSLFLPGPAGLADGEVAISAPFDSPGSDETLVGLAVRFVGPSADATGWVLAAMPARTLLGAFTRAAPAADARMAVFRRDDVLLAGSAGITPAADRTRTSAPAEPPTTALRTFSDGTLRLVGLQEVSRYGLKVVLTRDLRTVLGPWRGAVQLTAAGLVVLLLGLTASLHFAQRADRRRVEAQAALQAQMTRASKLEALGTLAGGVAHDFNNLLAAIVGYGEMARDDAPERSNQARYIDTLLQAALRGKALVERILAFSRGGARASTVFELQPVVEEVLDLLAASLRPGIVLERGLEAAGACLRGDPTQAFEAVMNLCTNAMQALPAGGMVGVELRRLHVDAPRVLSHSRLAAGEYLVVSVSDQGAGITPEVMERLFEPFFTTRSAQAGTGLGLAVVHGVVNEFGGAIDVQSEPGRGARFTLYLPECTQGAASIDASTAGAAPGRGQALLVVDDEPALVALAEEMLTGLGYDPVGYTDASAALAMLKEAHHRFAAVITDEVMPGLSGTQLTATLRPFAPQLPVLLISGYGGALLATRAAAAGVTQVLTKPLQRAELARALAELVP